MGSPTTSPEQSPLSLTKNTQSQTESPDRCAAPPDASPTTPPQQHCSTDAPLASVPASNQGPPSSASDTSPQSGPLAPPALRSSEASAAPSTAVQPQTQTQANGSPEPASAQVGGSSPTMKSHPDVHKPTTPSPSSALAPSSPQPGPGSADGSPVSDAPVPGFATLGRRLMLSGSDPHHPNHLQHHGPPHHHYPGMEHGVAMDTNKRHCYSRPAPQLHPASYSNYSTISIPLPPPQPPLPEKRYQPAHPGSPSEGVRPSGGHAPPSTTQHHVTFSPNVGEIAPPAGLNDDMNRVSVKFVQDSSRFWYKPAISREQGKLLLLLHSFSVHEYEGCNAELCLVVAIAALKEREPGTFLVRDSNSFQGAYGLALKVATPPPNVNHNSKGKNRLMESFCSWKCSEISCSN